MPYQPYDTGWIKPMYGTMCLIWFMYLHGILSHLTSVGFYNYTYVPFTILLSRVCELIGNIIISLGTLIIQCESMIFNQFNCIDPIFTVIQRVGSLAGLVSINIGSPKALYKQSNV
jgi:hypothetical protein